MHRQGCLQEKSVRVKKYSKKYRIDMTRWRDTKYMTTAKWMLYAKKADFNGIGTHFHISPVIARIIRNRDVCGDENIEKYLRGTWKDLID